MAPVQLRRLLPLLLLSIPLATWAAEPKSRKTKIEVPNLNLGNVGGALPRTDDLKKTDQKSTDLGLQTVPSDVKYEVLLVEHTSGSGPLESVLLDGNPPTLQKFATKVRVKASAKVGASIEVVILDSKGDTALSGSGELSFSKNRGAETDYLMEWSPVARPSGGDYKVLVRIAGRPMGTWPLKVVRR